MDKKTLILNLQRRMKAHEKYHREIRKLLDEHLCLRGLETFPNTITNKRVKIWEDYLKKLKEIDKKYK